jgi:Domain of unknown function (DUF4189)
VGFVVDLRIEAERSPVPGLLGERHVFGGFRLMAPTTLICRASVSGWAGAVLATWLSTSAAVADGAMAVGSSGNMAKDGFAFGAAINKPTREAAIAQALKTCRAYTGAPKMARRCKIIATFNGECYALTFDPKAGTPGVGWATGPTKAAAEDRAMAACEATAGAQRRRFCKIDQSGCDDKN